MWCAVYAVCHSKTAASAHSRWAPVHVHVCLCCFTCVYVCKGQIAIYHCHSQRQRKTLMLFHSDTYLSPLSLTLPSSRGIYVLLCAKQSHHITPWHRNSGLKPILLLHNHFSALSILFSRFFLNLPSLTLQPCGYLFKFDGFMGEQKWFQSFPRAPFLLLLLGKVDRLCFIESGSSIESKRDSVVGSSSLNLKVKG